MFFLTHITGQYNPIINNRGPFFNCSAQLIVIHGSCLSSFLEKHLVLRWYWTNIACDVGESNIKVILLRNPAPTGMYIFYINNGISYQPQLFSRISSINSNCLRCRTNSSFILKVSDFIVMSIVSINHNFIGFVLPFGGEGGAFLILFLVIDKRTWEWDASGNWVVWILHTLQ